MDRIIKRRGVRVALCWLPVLLFVFLTPGLSVCAAETTVNAAEPEYGSLDEIAGKK